MKCRKTWSDPIPGVAPYARYCRAIQRQCLDLYVYGNASYRKVASLVRSEVNGDERARDWDPEGMHWQKVPSERQVRLSHVTAWRWLQSAGKKARALQGQFGEVPQSGGWATDVTGAWLKGGSEAVLGICDAVTRVVFSIRKIGAESEDEVLRAFARLRGLGVNTKRILALVSDGAEAYRLLVEGVMKRTAHQRSVFHLWRNVLPHIKAYKELNGDEAEKQLKDTLHAIWDANTMGEAGAALEILVSVYGAEPILAPVLRVVQGTFNEAMVHLKGVVEGLPRSNNVCELLWAAYKHRLKVMGRLMSESGLDNFNAVWEMETNFRRYQNRKERRRRYRYPGKCPLEIAGLPVEGICWMDAVGI